MKPLHVALLVIGAALAGGLAVRMTQPQQLPVATAAPVKAATPPPAPVEKEVAPAPVVMETPPPPAPVYRKPSPHPIPAVHEKPLPAPRPVEMTKTEPAPPPLRPAPYNPAPTPSAEIPQPTREPETLPPPPSYKEPERNQVTLQAGTTISVRLIETLSTDHVVAGDSFQGSLAEPLAVDGLVIAERGARVSGRVMNARRAGHLSGTSMLELALTTLQTSDGQRVSIATDPWSKQSEAPGTSNAAKIGGGAVLGAIVGAIAGGGKGAAIGAGAGGVLGTGAAAATGAKPVSVASETILRFRLNGRVVVTERRM